MTAQLTLEPEPTAAGQARRWVRHELTERSRTDLVDAAVLGVSELVTNALLHVRGSIDVQIVDDIDGVRVEVYDDSPQLLSGPGSQVESRPTNPATVGRGLLIVASVSESWGVAYEEDRKCVWFLPVAELASGTTARASTDGHPTRVTDPAAQDVAGTDISGAEMAEMTLVDVPVRLLTYYRVRFRDLRREMTLIALSHDGQGTAAHQLHSIAQRLDGFRNVGDASNSRIDRAAEEGLDRITLEYRLPMQMVDTVRDLGDALKAADQYCREHKLLTLAAGPQERAMREWFFDEIIRQADGAAPRPWTGDFFVTDPEPLPEPS